ncbi:unnamed protein product, partial [Staurois parvus]
MGHYSSPPIKVTQRRNAKDGLVRKGGGILWRARGGGWKNSLEGKGGG